MIVRASKDLLLNSFELVFCANLFFSFSPTDVVLRILPTDVFPRTFQRVKKHAEKEYNMFGFEIEQNFPRCPPTDVLPKFLPTDVLHTDLPTFFLNIRKKYVPLVYITSESFEGISNFDENLLKFSKFQVHFPIHLRVV